MEGLIALIPAVMALSIPIVAIVTAHKRSLEKIKHERIRDEIELEKMKQINYVTETEKLRLELEQMKIGDVKKEQNLLLK
ncbi:hypothetical protein [Indiicoccus explosivorum]|uniref:hypothetical protein n=1 Tax=Indiicoccus explosivorum TaxID=1917864 RepID=UPI000B4403A6|nr:hypothetical protein [Indiicoccus explosivorum]